MVSDAQQPVLIIDSMNLFLRSFAAYPAMNANGEPMGGCIGFLKTLRRLVYEQQPRAVYIAWEGGGSQKRRKLYAEYKMNRKPEKLNRFYGDDIPESEENRKHQVVTLLAMLKTAPVCQIYVSDCEGDDLIAYLCRSTFRDVKKVIASSDKDLYQLLDETTTIYNLHKKTFINEQDVLNEFRVKVRNFAIAKALCGDVSDNVPGIKGMGFKTVSKLYPFLGTDENILLQDVINFAAAHLGESRFHRLVFEQQEDLRRNYKLVFLDGGMLSPNQAASVDHVVSTFVPKSNRMAFMKFLRKEGINDFDVPGFFHAFNSIDGIE